MIPAFFPSIHAPGTLCLRLGGESHCGAGPPRRNRVLMSDLNYAAAGVDYDLLDLFKRECQKAAGTTAGMLARHGLAEPPAVRGESAYLIELPDCYLAHVEE